MTKLWRNGRSKICIRIWAIKFHHFYFARKKNEIQRKFGRQLNFLWNVISIEEFVKYVVFRWCNELDIKLFVFVIQIGI